MPSLMDKIQAKLELLRLEKRYTRSRHRRSAFVSNAVYVDGEYVFQTPNSTGSSTTNTTSNGGIDALHGDKNRPAEPTMASIPPPLDERDEMHEQVDDDNDFQRRRMKRFSAMPTPSPRDIEEPSAEEAKRKKLHRFSSIPGFGSGGWDMNKTPRVSERRLSMIR